MTSRSPPEPRAASAIFEDLPRGTAEADASIVSARETQRAATRSAGPRFPASPAPFGEGPAIHLSRTGCESEVLLCHSYPPRHLECKALFERRSDVSLSA